MRAGPVLEHKGKPGKGLGVVPVLIPVPDQKVPELVDDLEV